MNTKIYTLLVIVILFGCSPMKNGMMKAGEDVKSVAIHNAILDFSQSCNLYKKDTVFSINFKDSVFNKAVLIQVDDRTMQWKRGSLCNGILSVGISADSDYKFLFTTNIKVGNITHLPSRHIVKDGKLFYWYDDSYPLTQEMLDILWKYNLLLDDEDGWIIIPDNPIDDSQKGAHYYFCKSDLSEYKRVITNIGMGFYPLPKLNCNKK